MDDGVTLWGVLQGVAAAGVSLIAWLFKAMLSDLKDAFKDHGHKLENLVHTVNQVKVDYTPKADVREMKEELITRFDRRFDELLTYLRKHE